MAKKKRKKKWIQKAIKHPGALTAQAKRSGKTVSQFCAQVRANPSRYSATTKRRCSLARTLRKLR